MNGEKLKKLLIFILAVCLLCKYCNKRECGYSFELPYEADNLVLTSTHDLYFEQNKGVNVTEA